MGSTHRITRDRYRDSGHDAAFTQETSARCDPQRRDGFFRIGDPDNNHPPPEKNLEAPDGRCAPTTCANFSDHRRAYRDAPWSAYCQPYKSLKMQKKLEF